MLFGACGACLNDGGSCSSSYKYGLMWYKYGAQNIEGVMRSKMLPGGEQRDPQHCDALDTT